MEENIQDILANEDENVVQFNFENNTSSPVAITLFDNASLLTTPTSGNLQTSFSVSNDLFPTLPPSLFAQNPNNGTFIASDLTSPILRLLNTTTNTIENDFDNSIGISGGGAIFSSILQSDNKIICGGAFTSYKGVNANCIIRLNTDGSIDTSFNYGTGFNSQVRSFAIQSDGKILVGGAFTTYKVVSANNIIRLNTDGSIDTSFDYGTGFNGFLDAITIQPDGKILCGGSFFTYKGVSANGIIRLNPDGSKDTSFDNSVGFSFGFVGIQSIAIQPDSKILVGGGITDYKGVSANRIIRLNSNGSIDTSFDYGTGFNGNGVADINIQPDGKILVGGFFTTYKGVTENRIIRLNTDGSKDTSFDNSVGFNNGIYTFGLQPNGKILVGGSFSTYKGVTANNIIRLNPDGSIDTSFDYGTGFLGLPYTINLQTNGQIICSGTFNKYNGYLNSEIIKLNSDGSSASTLNIASVINSIQYNSVNNKFYAEYSSGIYVISSDAQTIEADVSF